MSPSSPLKNDKLTRDHIIPFKYLNNKTYFKTLEHMLQNKGNVTHRIFQEKLHNKKNFRRQSDDGKGDLEEAGSLIRQYIQLKSNNTTIDEESSAPGSN